jgi:prepilin-type N-terminal cleavage/methylation domain-containing protein
MDKQNNASENGFTLLELMTAVAIFGVLLAMATPSMLRMRDRQNTTASATQMATILANARSLAASSGTPQLVYINPATTDENGGCGTTAVVVKDVDHSYSITPGDETREVKLDCANVQRFADAAPSTDVPMPTDDLAVRAPDAADVGAAPDPKLAKDAAEAAKKAAEAAKKAAEKAAKVAEEATKGGPPAPPAPPKRDSTVAETAVNGATFPVDDVSGRPVIAFSERGMPVDPTDPSSIGSGAGGIYFTDASQTAVVAAIVGPLGDVKLRTFDPASGDWK